MTPILLNDFKAQWDSIREDFLESTDRVGKSGYLILGQEVKDFEKALAHYWGLPFSIGCASGLDAIEISLRALGLQPQDKVLTTPLSAFATTLAILRAGGTPVFCDTDPSGLINLNLVEEILDSDPSIKFLVPVHLFGHALDLRRLKVLKQSYNLKIVEDCAQSIGTKSFGLPTGSVGDLAATSFYPTKNLGCYGDGGAVLTSEESLSNLAKSIRDYGQVEKYRHAVLGLNSRLDELQAAFLRTALLPRLSAWTDKRKAIARIYLQEIKNPLIENVLVPEGSDSCWHLFPVRSKNRDRLKNRLTEQKIHTGVHYPILIPDQPVFETPETRNQIEIRSPLENAKLLTEEELSLPIHPFLNDSEVARVVEACNSWKG